MRQFEPYSAVVCVYCGETAENFKHCLDSIFDQSIPPDELVVVCDGPLTAELEKVIESYVSRFLPIVLVRLDENKGVAVALNAGLSACSNDLIEKLGSDDVCRPERAELLLKEFSANPSLAVVGGYIQMYRNVPGDCEEIRVVPLTQPEIVRFSRRRNPFNDTAVMIRKSVIEEVGGYNPVLVRGQDYDLYSRIVHSGYCVKNIGQILCDAREDEDAMLRRKTWSHTSCAAKLRWDIFRRGHCGFADFILPTAAQALIMVLPTSVCSWVYKTFLRG